MISTTAKTTAVVFFCAAVGFLGVALVRVAGDETAPNVPKKADAPPPGLAKRAPWTTSRIKGAPEPPPPYRAERIFPKLQFRNPLLCAMVPGTDRFVVGEQYGKIYTFPNDPNCSKPDLFIDLVKELKILDPDGPTRLDALYGLEFHPQFLKNRYCYICYVVQGTNRGATLPDGSRVSRFTVTATNPPRVDPKSEQVLLTFLGGGHNGGCLEFGNDGMLYISTGDGAGPNPPDRHNTGQDTTDLLSSVLRIDVDHPAPGKPYAVPPDNPFVHTPNCKPEIWAFGFRNPWKMTFDRATGDLWVGDVGWELWEMVYRVKRGGNYGWSVMEGRQPVKINDKRGPTPILPPTLDFPHSEAASITGGYVYHGKKYQDLIGCYVCGDYVTGKVWATRFDGDKVVSHREIARTPHHVVAFGEDKDGELYYLHYDERAAGTLNHLVPNPVNPQNAARFPRKLSETGLFSDTAALTPTAGVVPFSINAEMWADHATAERLVALPHASTIVLHDFPITLPGSFFRTRVVFPDDGVVAKTIFLEMKQGDPRSRRRLETQILHFEGKECQGYTYQWNDEQTDATLVEAAGAEKTFTVIDPQSPGGQRTQHWRFHSRAECMRCHNPWTGFALAFTTAQLDKDQAYGSVVLNQLEALKQMGVTTKPDSASQAGRRRFGRFGGPPRKLINPFDPSADLTARARSYLHVNCSHCHQMGAGGTTNIDLRIDMPLERTQAINVRPYQGSFDLPGASILTPGDPYTSVLYYRMAKLGGGRMPYIGSEFVDDKGLRLIHDWIKQLPRRPEDDTLLSRLLEPSTSETMREDALTKLLATTSGALVLARAVDDNHLPAAVRKQAIQAAMARPDPQVRDLFERFIPEEQRVKRLGTSIDSKKLLALKGDPARGKDLFFNNAAMQCKTCHRIAGVGSTVGPDLSAIGKKHDRAKLLENLLEPSKVIEPQYVNYLVETKDGQVHTGILAEKSDKQIVLKNANDKETRIPADKVVTLLPQKTSIMPEQLLRDMTAEQVADLLAYLETLK